MPRRRAPLRLVVSAVLRLAVPAALLLAAGCYPTAGLLERVPTVPAGHLEWGITAGAEAMTVPNKAGQEVLHVYPDLEASVRQGLTDNLELGGRLWLLQAGGRSVLPAPAGIPTADGLLHLLALHQGRPPVENPGRWEPEYVKASSAERARVG